MSWPDGLGREDLLSLSFLERRENLVLVGDVGTGKTHMASALCQLACDRRLGGPVLHRVVAGVAPSPRP